MKIHYRTHTSLPLDRNLDRTTPVQFGDQQSFGSHSIIILRSRPMGLSQSVLPSSDLRAAILFGFLVLLASNSNVYNTDLKILQRAKNR
jgi:hypothetical protein